jgi:phage terminase large subunit-like protein
LTLATLDAAIAQVEAIQERHARNESLAEEAARLALDFRAFQRAAWPVLGYPGRPNTWHLDAIADHVQATYDRDIRRLVVSIQPGSWKSTSIPVLAPAWRWAAVPQERMVGASHDDDNSSRDATSSRTLIQSDWYQARWPTVFAEGANLKTRYSNMSGGTRASTHVGGGTGRRGGVLILDDPHNAREARYADTQLQEATQWWQDTWVSRLDDTVEYPGVMIVVGQRVHANDLIGFLLDSAPHRWTHLCLPTRYEPKHPFVYPDKVFVGGRDLQGDPRTVEGELLMPAYQDEERLADRVQKDGISAHVFAGQYQQRPAAREGNMLKRAGWRYYPREWSFYATSQDPQFTKERVQALLAAGSLPVFARIVCSWDTSVKDRAHSDYAVGSAWGVLRDRPADRWLLRLWRARAGLNETIDAMLMLHQWSQEMWPRVPVFSVIEKSANGPDAIAAIRSRLQGVIAYPEKGQALGSKQVRAEAASPALDGGNCFLPGFANETGTDYDPRTPQVVQEFVEELSSFDQGDHDDQVDSWSQMVNFTRTPYTGKGRVRVAPQRPVRPAALPA